MRLLGIVCLVVLAIAAVIWLRPGVTVPATARGPAASLGAPVTNSASLASAHRASQAVQSSRAEHIAESSAARTANARSAATQKARDASTHDTQQTTSDQGSRDREPPKPAGELFVPFIANDPAQVFAPATVNFHAAVQSEPIDPDWGPAAADALRNYIASQFGERFEIPYVDCRQDLCELQVAGRFGSDLHADMRDIQHAMSQMRQQPWWSALQFDQESGMVGSSQDDRVIVLWFLSRQ